MNMKKWMDEYRDAKVKKAMPILSFPSVQLLGIDVNELISDAETQAKGMIMIADRVPSAAAVSMMNLSLEAEAFGSEIRVAPDEVPTVVGNIVNTLEDAQALKVPSPTEGRPKIYIDAIRLASEMIDDRPVFAGVIGPFSLAGRLMDVTETMIYCYTEPEMVKTTLEKATEFLISYIEEYKKTGAAGVMMAEPLAGILSPPLIAEFSTPYVRRIIDATQTDDFIVLYHNCGNSTIDLIDSILESGAAAYHFGNAIDMAEMMKHIPENVVAMGNIDPSSQFSAGTPESIRKATLDLMEECCEKYPNFVISSGCDIPPMASWDNIDAFFTAVDDYYKAHE